MTKNRLSDPQQHDDLLNHQLIRLGRIGGAPAIRICEGKFGVSRAQWRIVAVLTEDGPMSPTQLIRRTLIEPGRVSKLVTEVMGKRLVERVEDGTDRRRATLRVTAAGKKLYTQLFPQLAAINRRLMSVLDEGEAAMLEQCLRKLFDHAVAIHAEGGGVEVQANRRRGGSRKVFRSAEL